MSDLGTFKGLGAANFGVEFLSTASTALALTYDQQGKLLIFNGQTSCSRILLPQPAAGVVFRIFFTGAGGVSSVHKICSTVGGSDILCGATTKKAVGNETTAQTGVGIELIGINEYRYVASRFGGSTLNINSTTT